PAARVLTWNADTVKDSSSTGALLIAIALLTPSYALAQAAAPPPPPDTLDARSAGLPPKVDWTFNFDAGWGSFGFANSYFNNPKGGEQENLSDQWFEGNVKPSLSGRYALKSGDLYGKVSVVGERTYGSATEPYGADVSSFGPEDAAIGWRSRKPAGSDHRLFDVSVGRVQYQLGHG